MKFIAVVLVALCMGVGFGVVLDFFDAPEILIGGGGMWLYFIVITGYREFRDK